MSLILDILSICSNVCQVFFFNFRVCFLNHFFSNFLSEYVYVYVCNVGVGAFVRIFLLNNLFMSMCIYVHFSCFGYSFLIFLFIFQFFSFSCKISGFISLLDFLFFFCYLIYFIYSLIFQSLIPPFVFVCSFALFFCCI